MQSENEQTPSGDIKNLTAKWSRISPTTPNQLARMLAELKTANRAVVTPRLDDSSLSRAEAKMLESWHLGLNRFTEGRFEQVQRNAAEISEQVVRVLAAEAKHAEALDRLARNDFKLKLESDNQWFESGGNGSCPRFTTLVACFSDSLNPSQTEAVENHFDHCDECVESFNADPSLSGYFPIYEIER